MERCNLSIDERFIQGGDYRPEGGAAAMSRLLDLKKRPTATLAVNDLVALGALQTLQARSVNVPGEMSLVGFDNIAMTTLVHPKLTTLSISREEMASLLYRALCSLRGDKTKGGKLYKVRASLVIRDSVADLERS